MAVSVGARACTCEAIRLQDILAVLPDPSTGLTLLRLRLRVTKNDPAWNQIVTLEGNLNERSGTNALYWLQQHLQNSFQLDLSQPSDWAAAALPAASTPLWKWSKQAMRSHLKKAAVKAGYPRLLLAFHSLRSGFICSALLKANAASLHQRTAVLETTGFVAGWLVGGRAQLRYIKTAAKGCIVASRLIAPTSEMLPHNPVELLLSRPEYFHGIELAPNAWTGGDLYRDFSKLLRSKIASRVGQAQLSEHGVKVFIPDCQERCYIALVQCDLTLEVAAREVYSRNPRWRIPKQAGSEECRVRQVIAKAHLERVLTLDNVHGMVDKVLGLLEPEYVAKRARYLKDQVVRSANDRSQQSTPERARLPQGSRRRVEWTTQEDEVLMEGVREGGSWVDIAKKLDDRSNVDCKDRHRNILKKRQREEEEDKEK